MEFVESAEYGVYYHLAPRSRRRSIQGKGLRCHTWIGVMLALCLARRSELSWLPAHVAQRHGMPASQLDCWQVRIPKINVSRWSSGLYVSVVDVPPQDIQRVSQSTFKPVGGKK